MSKFAIIKRTCEKFALAQEYKSIAGGFKDFHVLDDELAEKMIEIAGYRNRMVYLYSLITAEEIYHIVENELGAIHAFIGQVYAYLEQIDAAQ